MDDFAIINIYRLKDGIHLTVDVYKEEEVKTFDYLMIEELSIYRNSDRPYVGDVLEDIIETNNINEVYWHGYDFVNNELLNVENFRDFISVGL